MSVRSRIEAIEAQSKDYSNKNDESSQSEYNSKLGDSNHIAIYKIIK